LIYILFEVKKYIWMEWIIRNRGDGLSMGRSWKALIHALKEQGQALSKSKSWLAFPYL
jgi:hypothetical protein